MTTLSQLSRRATCTVNAINCMLAGFALTGFRWAFVALLLHAPLALAKDLEERPTVWGADLRKYLQDFDEEVLWAKRTRRETYRLTIDDGIRFRKTVIRLDRQSETGWLLTTKHEYRDNRKLWTRSLKTSDVQELVGLLNKSEFWSLPANSEFVDKEPAPDGQLTSICIDTPYWVLEAKVGDRYHGTGLYLCGQDDLFVPAGVLMIELVGRDLGYLD